MTDILYGEPDGDLPLSNVEGLLVHKTRVKLEAVSGGRFTILPLRGMGWYLADTTRPDLQHQGHAEERRNMEKVRGRKRKRQL